MQSNDVQHFTTRKRVRLRTLTPWSDAAAVSFVYLAICKDWLHLDRCIKMAQPLLTWPYENMMLDVFTVTRSSVLFFNCFICVCVCVCVFFIIDLIFLVLHHLHFFHRHRHRKCWRRALSSQQSHQWHCWMAMASANLFYMRIVISSLADWNDVYGRNWPKLNHCQLCCCRCATLDAALSAWPSTPANKQKKIIATIDMTCVSILCCKYTHHTQSTIPTGFCLFVDFHGSFDWSRSTKTQTQSLSL